MKHVIYITALFLLLSLANVRATNALIPIATDARIKTLIYSPTEIFRLKFHYNYQAYIEFPKNEKFELISVGDRHAWSIKQVGSRLFIKPKQAGVLTNMTIISDKRPYHFEIVSSNEDIDTTDEELIYVARFFYPETTYDFMQTVRVKKPLDQYNLKPINKESPSKEKKEEEEKDKALQKIDPKNQKAKFPVPHQTQDIPEPPLKRPDVIDNKSIVNAPQKLNFSYSLVGPETSVTPTKVYDNGIYTFFEFSGNELPDIYYVNADGSEALASYTIENGLVKIKNTSWQFSLRKGNELICIFNENKIYF